MTKPLEVRKVVPAVQLTETTKRKYLLENTPQFCPLCGREMKYVLNAVLDHDHKTGHVRGVMCRNCNALEGKINNLCTRAGKHIDRRQFLTNVIAYWERHKVPSGVLYPKVTRKKVCTRRNPWIH